MKEEKGKFFGLVAGPVQSSYLTKADALQKRIERGEELTVEYIGEELKKYRQEYVEELGASQNE